MTHLALALARDPDTPATVLHALAATSPDAHVSALLATHHGLPDRSAGELRLDGERLASTGWPLDDALTSAAATDSTRARLLRRLTTSTVLRYLSNTVEPHPAALTDLASRPPDDDTRTALDVEMWLAVHPSTPDERRLDALRYTLAHERADVLAMLADNEDVDVDGIQSCLATQALRYPGLLYDLASSCADPHIRNRLLDAAGHGNAHHDHIHRTIAQASRTRDVRAWIDAVATTGDPTVATRALDAVGPAHRIRIARVIAYHPALRGTPVARRAQVLLVTQVDAGAIGTHDEQRYLTVQHAGAARAFTYACRAPLQHTDSAPLMAHAWSHYHHDHDLTQPVDSQTIRAADPATIATFALHPATPDDCRIEAIASYPLAVRGLPADEYRRRRLAPLTRLVENAHTHAQLQTVLLDTALPDLRHVGEDTTEARILGWHLCRALRHDLRQLSPHGARTFAALASTFAGSPRELLDTATVVAA